MGLRGKIGNIAKKLATLQPGVQVYKKRKKIVKTANKARKKVAKVIRNRPTLYGGNYKKKEARRRRRQEIAANKRRGPAGPNFNPPQREPGNAWSGGGGRRRK